MRRGREGGGCSGSVQRMCGGGRVWVGELLLSESEQSQRLQSLQSECWRLGVGRRQHRCELRRSGSRRRRRGRGGGGIRVKGVVGVGVGVGVVRGAAQQLIQLLVLLQQSDECGHREVWELSGQRYDGGSGRRDGCV